MFNYERQNNQIVNPFEINGTDINISITSLYIDPVDATKEANITGSGVGDRNATFVFGRAKSSEFFYDDKTISPLSTPISVVVYCDTYPTCSELNNEVKINEPYWWLAVDHNETQGDGNITLKIGSTDPTGVAATVDTDVNILTNATDDTISVTRPNDSPLPLLVNIELDTSSTTTTNEWLIYNTDSDLNDPDPFYKVRFIGATGWAGYGKTGNVVDSNASSKKLKRLEW